MWYQRPMVQEKGGLKRLERHSFTICHSYHHEVDRVLGVILVAKFHHLATQKTRGVEWLEQRVLLKEILQIPHILSEKRVLIVIYRTSVFACCQYPLGGFFFLKHFFSLSLTCSQNLAKSSCGWSPAHLLHKIEGKKKEKNWVRRLVSRRKECKQD
jgi:hypothetical protein